MTIRSLARRSRFVLAAAGAGLLLVGGVVLSPSPASAHAGTETAAATCVSAASGTGRVVFTVANDHPLVATVTASDNAAIPVGSTILKSGSKTFTQTIPAPAAGVTASSNLSLRWSDGFTQSGITASATVDASCTGPATVAVPDLPVNPPTCTAAGSLPFTSNPSAQNPNGYEFPGLGYRVYLSPAYVAGAAGTYTATVQKIGAGFDPAFPNGTKVTGNLSQTLTVLPAIGNQTADENAPCFTRPELPAPVVVVGEWNDEATSCAVDTVLQHRVTTTTPYVWDETSKSYVADVEHVTQSSEERTRPKTDEEKEACAPIVTPPTDEPTPPMVVPPTDQPTAPTPTATTKPTASTSPAPTASAAAVPAKKFVADGATADTLAYTGSSPMLLGAGVAGVLAFGLGVVFLIILTIRRNRRHVDNGPDEL